MKKAIIVGAGGRGTTYAKGIKDLEGKMSVVAVAEPVDELRNNIKEMFSLDEEMCFKDWRDALKIDKFADCVVISTQDNMHYAPAMEAIRKGYDLLLEKPISPSEEECIDIAHEAKKYGVKVVVCHVLRFSPIFKSIKDMLDNGEIGELININLCENVGYDHYAHSYVRGNWRNTKQSSPMILAKSCHDMDMLQWLIGKKCLNVSSFGDLSHFKAENAPKGADLMCKNSGECREKCPFYAYRWYLDKNTTHVFKEIITKKLNPTDDDIIKALDNGQYGRCVYHCDNDVVDHQIVNLEFEDKVTASFSMCAFSPEITRTMKLSGTKGEIRAKLSDIMEIEKTDFLSGKTEKTEIKSWGHVGHGGGDSEIVKEFFEVISDEYTGKSVCDISVSVENHMIAFAAEKSRINGNIVKLKQI